jgi:hypothetical protein
VNKKHIQILTVRLEERLLERRWAHRREAAPGPAAAAAAVRRAAVRSLPERALRAAGRTETARPAAVRDIRRRQQAAETIREVRSEPVQQLRSRAGRRSVAGLLAGRRRAGAGRTLPKLLGAVLRRSARAALRAIRRLAGRRSCNNQKSKQHKKKKKTTREDTSTREAAGTCPQCFNKHTFLNRNQLTAILSRRRT